MYIDMAVFKTPCPPEDPQQCNHMCKDSLHKWSYCWGSSGGQGFSEYGHIYKYSNKNIYIYTCVYIYIYVYIYIHIYIYIHMYIYIYIHTYIDAYIHTHIHYIHTLHTYIHYITYLHAYIHT